MGKASRFFKSLLGFKTTDSHTDDTDHHKQLKRRWSLGRSRRWSTPCQVQLHKVSKSIDETSFQHHQSTYKNYEDPNKHAIAIAARMTGSGNIGYGVRGEAAAVKIQSCFRGYLARRALRALKALVKLQAVVRGHILRKQTVDMMRRLQALIRAQTRALAVRSQSHINGLTTKPKSHFHHHGPPTPEKIEHVPYTKHDHRSISKRNDSRSYVRGITGQERTFLDGLTDHENEKNVEVDTKKFHVMTKGRKLFQPDQISFWHSQSLTTSKGSTHQLTSSSPCASCELNYFHGSTRVGVPTPVKSEGSSCFSSYSNHPNYMANTESSRAKVRSLSAPRLRPQLEISNATKRDSTYKYVLGMQRVPSKRDSFTKKAYPGSCRLDQLGLPVYDTEESEFCVSYWN